MPSVSRGAQAFLKSTDKMLKQAQKEGANVTKAQVTRALEHLTSDGKVSQADVKAARSFLEQAPLTAGAKDALKNFVSDGPRSTDRSNSPLNLRLRGDGESVGGGESGGRRTRGGGESGGTSRRTVRGGGESGGTSTRVVRGGGESGGGGRVHRGGGESGGSSWGGGSSYGGGSYGGGE